MPWLIRRTRLSRVFPEAREQPEDSLDFLVRVLASRDAWMHRVDVADAAGVALQPGSHDVAQVLQVLRDLASTWVGPPLLLQLTGPGAGRWTLGGAHPPRAVLRADGLDLVRHVAGRAIRGELDLTGDPEACQQLRDLRIPF